MTQILSLKEAISEYIRDGDTVALEGFTHLIPQAAGHEIIRQGIKDLTLIRMTPDLVYDQMIGMGCARKLVFSWGGNPGVGSLHRLRDAVEHSWPQKLDIEEHSHAAMANAYDAGASGLPFAVFRGYLGTDYPRHNKNIRTVTCPYTDEKLATVPAIRPDVAVVHAQRADTRGNIHLSGIIGVQREVVLAAKSAIVTVEEIVEELDNTTANSVVLPGFTISAVCEVPRGAHPSYAHGYYRRHNAFYKRWDSISRDRETFLDWMQQYVVSSPDWAATWDRLKGGGYA